MIGDEVIAAAKRSTTAEVGDGLIAAVRAVLEAASMSPDSLATVMIGTTQFINAFVQRRDLTPVAAVRVALPKTDGIPPMVGWPEDLVQVVGRHGYLVGGGSFYDGSEYAPLDTAALENARSGHSGQGNSRDRFDQWIRAGPSRHRAKSGRSHSQRPSRSRHHPLERSGRPGPDRSRERRPHQRVAADLVSQSRDLAEGRIGAVGVRAPIYFSQNDGTLVSTGYATRFPIVTCSAGPTNSIRGAAFLTGLQDAIVMDIGGTTTDLGFLVRGISPGDGDRAPHRRGPYEFPHAGCPVHCPGWRDPGAR